MSFKRVTLELILENEGNVVILCRALGDFLLLFLHQTNQQASKQTHKLKVDHIQLSKNDLEYYHSPAPPGQNASRR